MSSKYSSDEYKTAWKGKTSSKQKAWGREITVGSLHQIQAKVLLLDANAFTTLKYYPTKNEVLFVRTGAVVVRYSSEKYLSYPETEELTDVELQAGDVFFIQSSCPYQIFAKTDSEIFEIGDNSRALPVRFDEESQEI